MSTRFYQMSHQLLRSAINHYWEIFVMEIMHMIGIVKG